MNVRDELVEILSKKSAAPFLFVGSGLSRRYINLENWDGILAKFCNNAGKPYSYYKGRADQKMPETARLICEDFYEKWWSEENFRNERDVWQDKIKDKTTPLRISISNYLMGAKDRFSQANLMNEVDLLRSCDVDGIITTNWDCFLEFIFPDYKVFVGQDRLLFANPLNVCEIYKIHGCCSDPNSLILTDSDYQNFNARNAYLAAKLITIFIEHPVIFIGYSLGDKNIQEILKSIAGCVGFDNLSRLRDNIIFVDRNEDAKGSSIENSFISFDSTNLPIKVVKTKDFSPIYSAVGAIERKMPARVLRFCREQVYQITKDANPEKKIAVIDFDKIDDSSSVEVVLGLGVISKFGDHGYCGIGVKDLFNDLINNSENYDPRKILEMTFPGFSGNTKYVPIYKYLRDSGVTKKSDIKRIFGDDLYKKMNRFLKKDSDFGVKDDITMSAASNVFDKETAHEVLSALLRVRGPDITAIENYLKRNYQCKIDSVKEKYSFRKIASYYDYLKFGFK